MSSSNKRTLAQDSPQESNNLPLKVVRSYISLYHFSKAADLWQMITALVTALAHLKEHLLLMMYGLWWLIAEVCHLKV